MDVGELMQDIDAMRDYSGMTVKELCEMAGVAPKTYQNWASGNSTPNFETLNAVLEALGIVLVPMYQVIVKN